MGQCCSGNIYFGLHLISDELFCYLLGVSTSSDFDGVLLPAVIGGRNLSKDYEGVFSLALVGSALCKDITGVFLKT